MKTDNLMKILLIVNFSLIGTSAFILGQTSANGYEISIYSALPSNVWYFLIADIILGISIVVYQAYIPSPRSWWILGMSTIMLSNMIILLLPVFRGYELYGRWDIFTHLGYVRDILYYNKIPDNLIYPAPHILIATIALIGNISEVSMVSYIIPFFLELYIIYMYCLIKTVFVNRIERIISIVASSVLFLSYLNYQVLPNTLSIFLMPIVFYTYLNIFDNNYITKKNIKVKPTFQYKLILIIFMISYPLFHPLIDIILIFTFLFTYVLMIIYDKRFNLQFDSQKKVYQTAIPGLIGFVVFILWISNNYRFWNNNIRQVENWFVGEAVTPIATTVSSIFEKLNMTKYDILELFIKMYGHIFIFLIFSFVALIIILKRIFRNKDNNLHHLYFLLGWFSIYNLFLGAHIFATILNLGFWRIIAMLIVTTPIFVGYVINKLDVNNNNKKKYLPFAYISVVMILSISSITGIFNSFPSPYILQANQQVTSSEIIGMNWYYLYKNISYNDMNIKSCFRFADLLLRDRTERKDILKCERADTKMPSSIGLVPKHFAYANFSRLSDFVKSDIRRKNFSYMPVFKFEKIYYVEMYPQLDEFNRIDFENLKYDTSLDNIYDNEGIDIYYILNNNGKKIQRLFPNQSLPILENMVVISCYPSHYQFPKITC